MTFQDKLNGWIDRFNEWRPTHMSDRRFMILLSIPTGFLAGAAAVIIKKLAHFIRDMVINAQFQYSFLLYFICPAIGILLTILFSKYLLKKEVGAWHPRLGLQRTVQLFAPAVFHLPRHRHSADHFVLQVHPEKGGRARHPRHLVCHLEKQRASEPQQHVVVDCHQRLDRWFWWFSRIGRAFRLDRWLYRFQHRPTAETRL